MNQVFAISVPQHAGVADKFMREAIKSHEGFVSALTAAKERAFDCGLYLISARMAWESEHPGEWLTFLASHKDRISERSAQRYVKFAIDMLAWAKLDRPKLRDNDEKHIAHARAMILQSSVSFIRLMEEAAGILRPNEGGGYRSPNRNDANGQQWFSFDLFSQIAETIITGDATQREAELRKAPRESIIKTRDALAAAQKELDSFLARTDGVATPRPMEETTEEGHSNWPFFWAYQNKWGRIEVKPFENDIDELLEARKSPSVPKVLGAFQAETMESAISIATEKLNAMECKSADLEITPLKKGKAHAH